MEWIITKEEHWCHKWDAFILTNPRGSHLVLSDWLKSYSSYGFDFELCIGSIDGQIIGGYGAIIAKALFFKFYIIPYGPVLSKGFEKQLDEVLPILKHRAKLLNCCYVQFSLPVSSNKTILDQVYLPMQIQQAVQEFSKGKLFTHVYCAYGINWVDFNNCSSSEEFMSILPAKTRRNIRLAYRFEAVNILIANEYDLKKGYELIEKNALLGNYSVRSYKDIENTILAMIQDSNAHFLLLKHEGLIKGASFSISAGRKLTNIFGGTTKGKPDIKSGYLMHWEWILKSLELGFKGYNISLGGSKGVKEFKAHFGAVEIFYEDPHYHCILRPKLFKLYAISDRLFKNNKALISILLKKMKRQ